jgi:hypothetical protein
MVTSLKLHGTTTLNDSCTFDTLRLKNAGVLGSGRVTLSLFNIETTSDMVGRSSALSCTHISAMLMYLLASDVWTSLAIDDSISSSQLPPSQTCHDYKKQECISMKKKITPVYRIIYSCV